MIDPRPAPRIRVHGAASGLDWVRRGLRLFARQPLALIVLVGLGPLLLGTLQVVPYLGDLAALILTPAMGLGMLAVCRSVDTGLPPSVACYGAALRDPVARLRLLQIGVYYALVAGVVALALSFVAVPTPPAAGGAAAAAVAGAGDGGAVAAPGSARPLPVTPDFTASPIPVPVFLALFAVMVPFAMTVWFAPVLSGWHHLSAPKALFFSFFACWRNRAAMLVYLITLLGLWVIAAMLVGSLIAILNAREGLAPYLLVAPLIFLTLAVAQAANYAMMQDVIDDESAPAPAPADPAPPQ